MTYHKSKCFRHIHNAAPYRFTLVRRHANSGRLRVLREDVPMCTICRMVIRRAWHSKLWNLQLSGTNALRIALNETFLLERMKLLDHDY